MDVEGCRCSRTTSYKRKAAGVVDCASWLLNFLLSRAPQGFQGEARRYVAPWVLSPPRRQTGKQDPSVSGSIPAFVRADLECVDRAGDFTGILMRHSRSV